MKNHLSGRLEFVPFECPEHLLVTARSHLIDRFVPECEIIRLAAKQVAGGSLTFERKHLVSSAQDTGRRRLIPFQKHSETHRLDGTVFFDLRLRTPQNWAHFLNNHLQVCFALMDETGLSPADVTLLLPVKTPGYIFRAAEFFGFRALSTDGDVEGEGVEFSADPWIGIRATRANWARLPVVTKILTLRNVHGAPADHLPAKVFLSRRNTRNLENEPEVEGFLAARGYEKIYPEDLSVQDQLRLFECAESVVAIHGAGLAPLLYLSDDSALRELIELLPCGHMTDVYRVMSHQVGRKWIGVRGKIKPEHIVPAYDLDNPFLKFSLQSFEVDLASLEIALEMV